MPPGGERDALGVGLLRGGQQLRPQHAVADDEPGGDPQPDRRRPLEQQVDGAGEVRPEDQRRRRAGPQQAVDELGGDTARVVGGGHPGLLRQRALGEPVQQRHPEPADHPDLREVDVGVDEAGQQHAAGQVDDLVSWPRGPRAGERPAVDDVTALDGEPAVLLGAQAATVERRVGGVQDGGAVDRHDTAPVPDPALLDLLGPLEPQHEVRGHRDRDRRRVLAGDLGQTDRRGDPGQRLRSVSLGRQLLLEPPPLRRRPDQPDPAQVPAPQGRVAQRGVLGVVVVMISTWLPAGSSPSTSSGTGAWWRCTRASASAVTTPSRSGSTCAARESTRCSSRSCRARIRASSRPTCPIPKIATAGTGRSGS